jgi:CHAT domain-containing protein
MNEETQLRSHLGALLTEPDSADVYALLSRRYGEVISQLRFRNPELASVRSVEPVTADSLALLLDSGTAVLEYYIGDLAGYAFVLRPGTPVAAVRLQGAGTADVAALVEEVRSMLFREFPAKKMEILREARLQRRLSPDEAVRSWRNQPYPPLWYWKLVELYSRLLSPVEEELAGVRRLYVVPHGALHQLPFAALIRPGQRDVDMDVHIQRPRYLIDDMAVAYLPSASVLPYALLKGGRIPRSGLVVGDPAYADPRYRRMPLPGALVEADTVASYVPEALLLTGSDAVESTVLRDMAGRDVMHFATHGELNPSEPMKSRILFAADNGCGCDGSLTVEEIFNLDIDATLVALSACQTAQVAGRGGGNAAGDELVGLTRSFLFAGTPAVLASLWVVDDQATLSWMREFYRSWLRKGLAPVDAARAAALGMLEAPADPDWIFPYYWAAFIYFGAMTDVSVSP